jgi:hypothetical protein
MTGRRVGLATLILTLLAVGTAWAAFEPEAGSPYPTGGEPYSVYAADFNGDARPDLAVLNGTSSDVNIYLRQTGGGFAQEAGSPVLVGTGYGPSFGAPGDFNGDGRPDFAVANFVKGSVSVLYRLPGGGFDVQEYGAFGTNNPSAIAAGDFNSDGLTDLAVGIWNGGNVTIMLRNPGNDGFTTTTSYGTGLNPRQIEVADFNGDSLADLAVTNAGSDSVTILLRSAGGGFVAEGTTAVGDAPQDLVAADLNGDGRSDLAVANNDSTVSVLLRDATNSGFVREGDSDVTVGGNPAGITSADFNRDGRPDLAVAASGAGLIVLLRSAGGGFTADAPLTTDGLPFGVAAADFDGDGTPDLATTSLNVNTLSIFRNPAPVQPPVQTPTPPPAPPVATPTVTPAPVAPPVAGRSVNATPVEGKVKVKLPGSRKYVDLSQAANLPVGTTVDTRDGKVTIVAAGKGGQADFFDGIFKISQTKGSRPLTTLRLSETLSCPRKGKAASAAARKTKTRKLWGDGKGRFRTSGKYAAATVRGTKWLVTDYCDRTKVRVTQGVVSVRDNVRKRTVTVRKGKPYTARAKRR